jgi:hypothetical protein
MKAPGLFKIALFSSLAACGGSVSSPGGRDSGTEIPDSSATGTTATATGCPALSSPQALAAKGVYDTSYPGLVTIVIVNHAITCTDVFVDDDLFQNMVTVGFTLGATDSATVVTPGTYTGGSLTGACSAYGAMCQALDGGSENTGGTVTLTSAGPTYAGTYTFDCECGSYSGSFEAPLCAVSGAGPSGDAGAACMP